MDKVAVGILPGSPPALGYHRFAIGADGALLHFTGNDPTADQLRAVIPPEGWDDYGQQFPDARSVIIDARNAARRGSGQGA